MDTTQPGSTAPQSTEVTPQQHAPEHHGSNKKKSTLTIASIVIVILVIGVTAFFALSKKTAPQPVANTSTTVVKQPLTLTLESPTENSVVQNSQVQVKGKTLPNATVAFYTDSDDNSVQSDADGNFSGTINLENGINTLTVTAYSDDGDEKSMVMDIVYDESATQ